MQCSLIKQHHQQSQRLQYITHGEFKFQQPVIHCGGPTLPFNSLTTTGREAAEMVHEDDAFISFPNFCQAGKVT